MPHVFLLQLVTFCRMPCDECRKQVRTHFQLGLLVGEQWHKESKNSCFNWDKKWIVSLSSEQTCLCGYLTFCSIEAAVGWRIWYSWCASSTMDFSLLDCWLLVLYGSSREKRTFLLDVDRLSPKSDVYSWCFETFCLTNLHWNSLSVMTHCHSLDAFIVKEPVCNI